MNHLPQFIHDLSYILITAALCILLFRFLKLPSVIGFILAGFFVGPQVAWMPTALDQANIQLWGEIGILFIVFGLGLEMSFKKLFSLGGKAILIALIEVSGVFAVGFFAGKFLSMETTASLYLGAILSVSSTSIIIRALNELKLKNNSFAGTVFGVLIVEDLLAVIMMILLLGKGISESFDGWELAGKIVQLIFFIILWGGLGRYFIPWCFRLLEKKMNEETLLLVSVGLCFGMVGLASQAGLSAALGAFMMGSILAETKYIHQIEKLFQPLKIFFSAVFFVSVGMLIQPVQLVDNWKLVLMLSLLVILAKLFFAMLGSLFVGETLRNSLSVGSSLTQIGEFSFIIAVMGQNSKILGPSFYPVIVGVSTVTSLLTPVWMLTVQKIFKNNRASIENNPKSVKSFFENYRISLKILELDPLWGIFVQSYFQSIFINLTFIFGIYFFIHNYFFPWISELLYSWTWGTVVSLVFTFALTSPFYWMLSFGRINKFSQVSKFKFKNSLWFRRIVLSFRWVVAASTTFYILMQYFSQDQSLLGFLMLLVVSPFLTKFYKRFYGRLESYFLKHIQIKEKIIIETQTFHQMYQPWELQLHHVVIPEKSLIIGKTISELRLREDWKINLVILERGIKSIVAPKKFEVLMPLDKLHIVADEEHFQAFCDFLEMEDKINEDHEIIMHPFLTTSRSPWLNKQLMHSTVRELTEGLVVGVEKSGERILNPQPELILELGDLIWVVGEKKKVLVLQNEIEGE